MFDGFSLEGYKRKAYSKDPNKIYWLVDTSYGKNHNHTLHFLAEDGQEKRISIRDVRPFFYVRDLTPQAAWDRLDFYDKRPLVHSTEAVQLKNPITRQPEVITKITTVAPGFVSNVNRPEVAVSTIFKAEKTHNNHIPYHNVILNESGYVMGMPYRFNGKIPVLVDDKLDENRSQYDKVFESIPLEAQTVGESVFQQIHAVLPDFAKMIAAADIEIQANFAESVDASRAEVPITSLGVTTWEKTVVFVLDNESLENDPPEDPAVFDDGTYEKIIFNSEKKLLIEALTYIKDLPQRLLIWFNGDDFDVPYIARRLELHGLKDFFGIEGYVIKGGYYEKTHYTRWEGKIVLDLYKYFKNDNIRVGAYRDAYPNNKLDTIAKALIGQSKYDYEGQIESLSSEELAFYNAKDCQLTFDLATHQNSLPAFLLFFIMRFSNLSLPKANRKGITAWWSGFQFRNMHSQGFYYPNRSVVDEDLKAMGREFAEKLSGGDVLDAIMGVYRDVTIIDFASLYPTNIIKNNICYSTINCNHPECQPDQSTAVTIKIPEGTMWTCRRHIGFTVAALMFFRGARVDIYKPRANKKHPEYSIFFYAIAQFFKIFMNAAYGCFKNPGFAFFHILAAQGTTGSSRHSLWELVDEIRKLMGEPIYGDSVSGLEPVIVRIDESVPIIMSLENLWNTMEEFYDPQTHHESKERMTVRDITVWDGRDWNEVRAIIRHATYKTMQRVSTGIGVVDVTADHSLVDERGDEFKPSDIDKGKTPHSEVFPLDIVHRLREDESLTQLLFLLFSLNGTASYSRSIYESQRTLAIHVHSRYSDHVVNILQLCTPIIEAFGSSYKIYPTTTKRKRIIIKFRSHIGLWKAVRDNCYYEKDKIRPVRLILGMTEEHQSVAYNYMKAYYYKPPKAGGDRWRFGTNVEMQAYSVLAAKFDKKKFTFYPLPRGNTYHAKYSSKMKRGVTVTELKTAAEYVFDLETADGTFMVSNIKCHNTDSVFVTKVPEDADKLLSAALGMEVENEGTWKIFIQYKKKNYIKINPDNIEIKGLMGIKKATALMIRKIFKDCVDEFKADMNITNKEMLDKVYEAIRRGERKIYDKQFTLEDLQLSQTLSMDLCFPTCAKPKCTRSDHYKANTPLVQAAKSMVKHLKKSRAGGNRTFGRKGVVVDYVRTKNEWTPTVLASAARIDTKHYVDQLHRVFGQLTAPLGYDTVRALKKNREIPALTTWFEEE